MVHEKEIGPAGVKTQQVDIYYKFIGSINQKHVGGCKGEVIKEDQNNNAKIRSSNVQHCSVDDCLRILTQKTTRR